MYIVIEKYTNSNSQLWIIFFPSWLGETKPANMYSSRVSIDTKNICLVIAIYETILPFLDVDRLWDQPMRENSKLHVL